jgi:formylglycine-generating enzyme required for sulfatase activity
MNSIFLRAVLVFLLLARALTDSFAQTQAQAEGEPKTHASKTSNNPDNAMVFVHGGTIQVGIDFNEIPHFAKIFDITDQQLFQDEVPKHPVSVDDFYIDKRLVTNAQFKSFIDVNPAWQPRRVSPLFDNGNYLKHWVRLAGPLANADHPVVNVNWYAAVAYCTWAGKRLPSEAEWEHAARGGLDALFPWGNEPVDENRANFGGSGLGTTSPVGNYPANRYGLFDMAGNVWEFTLDEWKPYPTTSASNPVSTEKRSREAVEFLQVTTRRVIRGGSFDGAPVNLWVDYRDSHPPNGSREFVGFRCAK